MTLFDTIGKTYYNTRRADERIVACILTLLNLPDGSQIADIGAGTGNYSIELAKAGFQVKAIEPSSEMISKARLHKNIEWLQGAAEDVPLGDSSVDGVVSTLAVCHFSDTRKALEEMARITRANSIVIFNFDCDVGRRTWMYEYFPFFWDLFDAMPSSQQLADMLADMTRFNAKVEPFLLPSNITDGFAAAAWQQPSRYLDERYRANISSFVKAKPDIVAKGVQRLADDLANGVWAKRYGSIAQLSDYDAGYRFVYTSE